MLAPGLVTRPLMGMRCDLLGSFVIGLIDELLKKRERDKITMCEWVKGVLMLNTIYKFTDQRVLETLDYLCNFLPYFLKRSIPSENISLINRNFNCKHDITYRSSFVHATMLLDNHSHSTNCKSSVRSLHGILPTPTPSTLTFLTKNTRSA